MFHFGSESLAKMLAIAEEGCEQLAWLQALTTLM